MKRIIKKYADGSISTSWIEGEGEETILVNANFEPDPEPDPESLYPTGVVTPETEETPTGKHLKEQREFADDDDIMINPMYSPE